MSETLVFSYGSPNPVEGLHLRSAPLPECGPEQVVVQFLASPINPLDFLVLYAKYPAKPQNTIEGEDGKQLAIPGSDGAGRIIQAGPAVRNLSVGDVVILRSHCRGTWRTHAVFEEGDLIRVPNTIDARLASILRMGVAPAHFLLREYHTIEPGEWIMQNAATGTISHFVGQLAQIYGIKVISIIRDRSTADELERTKRSLRSHGASLVLTEEELRTTTELRSKRIVMAIDSVSDDTLARDMAAHLVPGATFITAGFLGVASRPEVNLRQFLWTRNITLKPFRLSDCLSKRDPQQQASLFEWFADLLKRGSLKAPSLEYIHWKQGEEGLERKLQEAITKHDQGEAGQRKKILVFGE
ncbi:Nuclear receptor-binding factor 1-like protein [Cladobotryum mycophilum]|uniref:enoyl-[acyl-carrier-protein] reductase n=1 Tax=Cladobotryum mycophilum TaxID=491253 RepID=A0ABR0T226_9HYPO